MNRIFSLTSKTCIPNLIIFRETGGNYSQLKVISESFKKRTGFLVLGLIQSIAFLPTFSALLVMCKLLDSVLTNGLQTAVLSMTEIKLFSNPERCAPYSIN